MTLAYPKHTLLHDNIRYAKKTLTEEVWLSKNVNGVGVKYEIGTRVNVRIREWDWGISYTAFIILKGECFSKTLSTGITPKEYIYNVNSEILEDLYAKKFCL